MMDMPTTTREVQTMISELAQLEAISRELGRLNRNIEKFLKRDDVRINVDALKKINVDALKKIREGSLKIDMPEIVNCVSCFSEINYRGGEPFEECAHGRLCYPCAPWMMCP